MSSPRILILDDVESFLEVTKEILEREGYDVETASTTRTARSLLDNKFFDLLLLDERIEPSDSGLDFLLEIRTAFPGLGAILISGHADLNIAVRAMRVGVVDLLVKPVEPDEFVAGIRRALDSTSAIRRARRLRWESMILHSPSEILGTSPGLREALEMVASVAPTNASVLIQGESGTGKELIARAVHAQSARRHRDMVCFNAGAISPGLMESTLFGSKKGSYTDSRADERGFFQEAHNSTIFLDEIGETTPEVQVRLLRVLQEKVLQRVGDPKPIPVDVRIVAATNRNLTAEINNARFRHDLYYRLAVMTICLPPLRERVQDIAPLAAHFLQRHNKDLGKNLQGFTEEALHKLETYHWPGNIRELENVIQRAVILETSALITGDKLRVGNNDGKTSRAEMELRFAEAEEQFQRGYFLRLRRRTDGTVNVMAEESGLHRSTIHKYLKKLGVE